MKKFLPVLLCTMGFIAGHAQTYAVSQITYAPDSFSAGNPVIILDDEYSGIISLPFDFCFFGNTYNKCVIGQNGFIRFDTTYANVYCPWPIAAAIPSSSDPANAIFAPWQDLYNDSMQLLVFDTVYGTAPNRRFVVTFHQVHMYSCTNLSFTGEVMLYEGSGNIEIHIHNKELCTGWNGGYAIEGIQNANGTSAFVVPGRNYPTQWTATDEAWRFSPDFCSTGIASLPVSASPEIFPNPSSGDVRVRMQNYPGKFAVKLTDATGRELYRDALTAEPERELHLESLAAGFYFLSFSGIHGEILATRRIIIK